MEAPPLIKETPETEQLINEEESKEFALIMKGGGAKGLAYVGALQVLEQYGYRFTWFVGTSAGAITAVLLAAGYTANELEDILRKTDFKQFRDVTFLKLLPNIIIRRGLFSGDELKIWIESLLNAKLKINQGDVYIKLRQLHKGNKNRLTIYALVKNVGAKDFDSHQPDTSGYDASWTVRASASIPYFFTRTFSQDGYVFDGGLSHNYPIDVFLTKYNEDKKLNFLGLYLGSNSVIYKQNGNVLSDMLDSWLTGNDKTGLIKYGEKTVVIDPFPITTLQFDLHEKEKEFLLAVGKASALEFLANQENTKALITEDKLNEAKAISDNLRNEVKQISKNRKRKRRIKFAGVTLMTIVLLGIIYFVASKYFVPYKPDPQAVALNEIGNFLLSLQKTQMDTDNAKNIKSALILFRQAMSLDNNYYQSYLNYAEVCLYHEDSIGSQAKEYLPYALDNIQIAKRLAEQQGINDPDIEVTLGFTYFNQWKWAEAETVFCNSTKNSPSAEAFINYARLTRTLGDNKKTQKLLDEALKYDSTLPRIYVQLGMFQLTLKRDYDPNIDFNEAAIKNFEKSIELKGAPVNYCWISVALLRQGKIEEAITAATTADDKYGHIHDTQAFLAYAYAHDKENKEREKQARDILAKLKEDYYKSTATAVDIAVVYAGFKDRDNTIDWLNTAVKDESGVLATYIVMPQFEFLHDDPEFIKIKSVDLRIPQKLKYLCEN